MTALPEAILHELLPSPASIYFRCSHSFKLRLPTGRYKYNIIRAHLPASCSRSQLKPSSVRRVKSTHSGQRGYVEDHRQALLSVICPCNLVGKPCAFDQLEQGCPMIRLCGQLEKWTTHKCPDKGFQNNTSTLPRMSLVDYGEKGFGAVNFYDSSDNESGGVDTRIQHRILKSISSDANGLDNTLQPSYRGMKVSFNDFLLWRERTTADTSTGRWK